MGYDDLVPTVSVQDHGVCSTSQLLQHIHQKLPLCVLYHQPCVHSLSTWFSEVFSSKLVLFLNLREMKFNVLRKVIKSTFDYNLINHLRCVSCCINLMVHLLSRNIQGAKAMSVLSQFDLFSIILLRSDLLVKG
jgi:hypothetical protein